jgi:hypothetical protein
MNLKKDFIVSRIEAPQDGSQYVLVAFTDPNEPKSIEGGSGGSYPQSPFGNSGKAMPFASPEDLMKNLPRTMSDMYGTGGGMSRDSPIYKITMKEYEDMAIKVGDKVGIEISKVVSNGI